jgi:hypothetical protein
MAQNHAGVHGMRTSLSTSEYSNVSLLGVANRLPGLILCTCRDDSEIDWKTLPDPNWNLWSAHTLQRRWLTMKRSVRGHEDMTHAGWDFQPIVCGFAGMTDIYLSMQRSWTSCVSRSCIHRVRDRGQSSARKLSRTPMTQTTTWSSLTTVPDY